MSSSVKAQQQFEQAEAQAKRYIPPAGQDALSKVEKLELGQVGSNSHPVHPATIHMPLTFLLFASAIDVYTYLSLNWKGELLGPLIAIAHGTIMNQKDYSAAALTYQLSLTSYLCTIAAIVTSVPAITSGVAELLGLIKKRGFGDRATKIGILHAALNDVAVAGVVYNWLSRRKRTAFETSGTNASISAVLLFSTLYSAYLGGSLIYKHGVGVKRMGEGLKKKQAEDAELKRQGRKDL